MQRPSTPRTEERGRFRARIVRPSRDFGSEHSEDRRWLLIPSTNRQGIILLRVRYSMSKRHLTKTKRKSRIMSSIKHQAAHNLRKPRVMPSIQHHQTSVHPTETTTENPSQRCPQKLKLPGSPTRAVSCRTPRIKVAKVSLSMASPSGSNT